MSSTSSSSEDDLITSSIVTASCLSVKTQLNTPQERKGGSRPGKRGNRDIKGNEGAKLLDRDYFCRNPMIQPIFTIHEFERRFSVSPNMYEKIRKKLMELDSFFLQKTDACGILGSYTDQKLSFALFQLSSDCSADTLVGTIRLSESLKLESLKRFCASVVSVFSDQYPRKPSLGDIKRINDMYMKLGFPGCLGALDCSGWQWANWPVALHGQYKGKEGKPTIRMETLCNDQLWIWSMEFGAWNLELLGQRTTSQFAIKAGF